MKEECWDKKSIAMFTARPYHLLYQHGLIHTKKKMVENVAEYLKIREVLYAKPLALIKCSHCICLQMKPRVKPQDTVRTFI